jgi:UDP-GlcNAc3NAcA epimerase
LHRAENTDNPKRLKSILRALNEINKDTPVVLPLHPRTKKNMKSHHLEHFSRKIKLIDPVSYFDMLTLEKNTKAILTDSGGVQKEAYWFKVPCFTLRDETEWVETIQSGQNVLVGADWKRIVEEIRHRMERKPVLTDSKIFGDGRASEKILQVVIKYCG